MSQNLMKIRCYSNAMYARRIGPRKCCSVVSYRRVIGSVLMALIRSKVIRRFLEVSGSLVHVIVKICSKDRSDSGYLYLTDR